MRRKLPITLKELQRILATASEYIEEDAPMYVDRVDFRGVHLTSTLDRGICTFPWPAPREGKP